MALIVGAILGMIFVDNICIREIQHTNERILEYIMKIYKEERRQRENEN